MKNTALLIDTNVVLDWLLERQPFANNAERIMENCINGSVRGYLAAHSLLNIFYITRKAKSVKERKEIILMLCDWFEIIGIDKEFIVKSLQNDEWRDLEDCLHMQSAIFEELDYIITRDIKDFIHSFIKAVTPEEFLQMLDNDKTV
jgi:predicted nucleic acid-binding protein